MDYGHSKADKNLIALEMQLKKEYARAYAEMKQKADDYFKAFADADKKKKQLLSQGKITPQEYAKWRQAKMATGKRYNAMVRTLANDMTRVNQHSMDLINASITGTFIDNVNYAGYEVCRKTTDNLPFTLYDENAVKRLVREDPTLLPKPRVDIPKDRLWNRRKINSAILQGILQGESIDKIAKRLRKVADMNRSAAIRNARTMTTSAENAGRLIRYKEAQDLGIELQKKWIATLDHVTRDSHVDVDGEVVDIDKLFSNGLDYPGGMGPPEEVYNCFVADTEVAVDSEIIRGYRHRYDGEVISVKTASGVNFTCTPNHPILTRNGWVKANLLNNGQDLFVTSRINAHNARRNPYINHVFARFDTLFEFIKEFGGKRTSALSVDFHGDIATTKVEIIAKEGFLRSNVDSISSKEINKFLLKGTDKSLMSESALMKHFGSVRLATFSFISRLNKVFTFFGRSLSHPKIHSLRPISRSDAIFLKSENDRTPTDSELFCKGFDRLSEVVFVDKIIDVYITSFHGYVYNLQTENNYYFVNSSISDNGIYAIAHNCRCTMVSEIKGHKYKDDRYSKLGNMSYADWKAQHAVHREAVRIRAERRRNGK